MVIVFYNFNGFWRENDVTRVIPKLLFLVMAKVVSDFERTL